MRVLASEFGLDLRKVRQKEMNTSSSSAARNRHPRTQRSWHDHSDFNLSLAWPRELHVHATQQYAPSSFAHLVNCAVEAHLTKHHVEALFLDGAFAILAASRPAC